MRPGKVGRLGRVGGTVTQVRLGKINVSKGKAWEGRCCSTSVARKGTLYCGTSELGE